MQNPTLDDVRMLILDFMSRLKSNGLAQEKAKAATFKVGRLLALRVMELERGAYSFKCDKCPICHEEPDGLQALGHGNPNASVVLIGQGLGATEAQYALPFVGIAGTLLTAALEDAGLPRETVWLTNIVGCRPKDNRAPERHEALPCFNMYAAREIDIIRPRAIVALGMAALQTLIDPLQLGSNKISSLRGNIYNTEINGHAYPVIATFHPAYVVRKHGSDFADVYSLFVSDIGKAQEVM